MTKDPEVKPQPEAKEEKVIETPTMRLTVDETRTIMAAMANCHGKATTSYHASALVALGIFQRVPAGFSPRWRLESVRRPGSHFYLDPCAADENPAWVAKRYLTKAVDGLTNPWTGRVFMNPPFSNTAPWIRKHAEHGIGISLVPASVESQVWREVVWQQARAILLLHGRTRFANPDGSTTTGRPLRSVALIAWSENDAAVLRGCSLAGVLLESWVQR